MPRAIGNREYTTARRVRNAAVDAAEVVALFERVGYDRTDLHLDLKANDFDNAVAEFHEASVGAKLCAMYYAGHSVQVDGVNYLLGVETVLASRRSLGRFGVRLDEILDGIEAEMSIVILDACRDDPFPRDVFMRDEAARAAATKLDQPADPELRQARSAGILFATSRGKKANDD